MRAPDVRRLVALIALALVACGGPSHPARPITEIIHSRSSRLRSWFDAEPANRVSFSESKLIWLRLPST